MKFAALIATVVLLVCMGMGVCDHPGLSDQASRTSVTSCSSGGFENPATASATLPAALNGMTGAKQFAAFDFMQLVNEDSDGHRVYCVREKYNLCC